MTHIRERVEGGEAIAYCSAVTTDFSRYAVEASCDACWIMYLDRQRKFEDEEIEDDNRA